MKPQKYKESKETTQKSFMSKNWITEKELIQFKKHIIYQVQIMKK